MNQKEFDTIINNGTALDALIRQEGWNVILEFLETYEEAAKDDVITCRSSDLMIIRAKQLAAKAVREVRLQLIAFVETSIASAREALALKEAEYEREREQAG